MSVKKTEIKNTKSKAKTDSAKKQAAAAEKSVAKAPAKSVSESKTTSVKSAAKNAPKAKSAPKQTADMTAPADKTAKKAEKKPAVKKTAEAQKLADKQAVSESKKKAAVKQNKAETAASKKSPATKTAEKDAKKSPAKKPAKKLEVIEPSSKTPHVMKLVEQKNDMINPTIMAGKSSIPRRLRGLEPLSRIIKREAEEVFGGDTETYNLTALVIEEHAPEILRRFNACDCEICVETLSRLTAEMVPARFAKLRRSTVERDLEEVRQLKDPLRRPVTSHMVRLVMQNKKRSYHD